MSSVKTQLRAIFDLTGDYLQALTETVKKQPIHHSRYFELPAPTTDDERQALSSIPVTAHDGQQALLRICNSYTDFYKQQGLSSKMARRHPGLIVLAKQSESELVPYIDKINELKMEFKKLVLTYDNNDARFDAVHSAVPGLQTLSFYRRIHYEGNSPSSVRFTWMKKHSTKSLSRKLALTMLERSSAYSNPRMIDQTQWQRLVEQEKAKVASLSHNEKLRIRRPIRVTPEVNVRFSDARRYHVSGALPFIVFDDNPDLKLGELTSYTLKEDPRKREYEYLVERLYLAKGE